MQGWKEFKLNELGKVGRGKSKHRPRNDSSLYGGKYPFVQTGDVKAANFYVTEYSQTYNEKGLAQSKLWKKGTLCITIAANISETSVLGIDACFPDSIIGFVPYDRKSDVRFIKYHFDLLKIHLQSISQGTTQDNLSQEKLLRFNFRVPENFEKQQRIASVLSAYDELIEVNNQRIKLLEETARELYKEWFVRMRFPGYKEAKFVKGVPEGWEIVRIGEVINIKNGKECELVEDGVFKVYGSNGQIGLSNKSNYADVLIIGRVGAYCGCIEIGTGKIWATDNTLVAIPNPERAGFYFSYYLLKILDLGNFSGGSAQPLMTQSIINRLKIVSPSKELIKRYESHAVPIFEQTEILHQQNSQLLQIRDRLLPRLIGGKLEVKV